MRTPARIASIVASILATSPALAQDWTPFGFNDPGTGALHVTTTATHLYACVFSDGGNVGRGIWRRDLRTPEAPWELVGLDGDILSQLVVRPAPDGVDTLVALSEATFHPGPSPLVQRSLDGGAAWSPADAGLEDASTAYVMREYPHDPDVLQVVASGDARGVFYRTTDFGDTWERLPDVGSVNDLAFSPLEEGIAYTTIYTIFFSSYFGRSTDGGITWQLENEGKGAAGVLRYGRDGWLYRARYASVLRLPYGDAEWDTVEVDPSGGHIYDLFVAPWDPSTLVASFADPTWAVFRSSDRGATWSEIPSPIGEGDYPLSSAGRAGEPGVMYLATFDSGLWRLELSGEVAVEEEATSVPGVHAGARVGVDENPAASHLRVRFVLPRSGSVEPQAATLAIYDVAGRTVRTWSVTGRTGEIGWDGHTDDGHAVAPGRYVVALTLGATRAVTPFVWLGR
jgi:hypothetical protein